MASVTQRISEITQPHGGYLPVKMLSKNSLDDGKGLYPEENINPSIVGACVDYLSRFMLGETASEAFDVSLKGAFNLGMLDKAYELVNWVTGLDDMSITCACKLAGFDVAYRVSKKSYKSIDSINPDEKTIYNIRVMVGRVVDFFTNNGPVTKRGFDFEGGYSEIITAGDGDFLTNDTLWDLKVTKSAPTSKYTLQLLIYYVMGCHSIHSEFQSVVRIGIYNPRLNIAYTYPVSSISSETINEISLNVIGYGLIKQNIEDKQYADAAKRRGDYSVKDISSMTGMSTNRIYENIRNGNIQAYKKGNKYYINKDNAEKYIEMREMEYQKQEIARYIFMALFGLLLVIFIIWLTSTI